MKSRWEEGAFEGIFSRVYDTPLFFITEKWRDGVACFSFMICIQWIYYKYPPSTSVKHIRLLRKHRLFSLAPPAAQETSSYPDMASSYYATYAYPAPPTSSPPAQAAAAPVP